MRVVFKLVCLLALLSAIPCSAQTFDDFGGLLTFNSGAATPSCGSHPQVMTITAASQSGTTQTVTVAALPSAGVSISGDETFYITGTGTAMDFVFASTLLAGSSILTGRSSNTLTLTGVVSNTVSGVTTGTIYPAKAWFRQLTVNGKLRQVLCTPEGHWLFYQGVAAWVDYNGTGIAASVAAKYGNSVPTMDQDLQNEFAAWNFNGVGELSSTSVTLIGSGGVFWPEIDTLNLTLYSGVNLSSYASGPLKDLGYNMSAGANTCWYHGSFGDFFAPQYAAYLTGYMSPTGSFGNLGWQKQSRSPWQFLMMIDDTDWFWGMGAGPDFRTVPTSHNACDPAYNILTGSPVVTATNDPNLYGGQRPQIYSDTKNYSKTAMASPPATCSVTTPCSVRTFLAKKYVTIGALNTAWGSSYTTLDSSGTVVTGEAFDTGDGSTLSFSHTLAHTPIDQYSVQILVAGTNNGGDCPNITQKGGCSGVAGQGTIVGPNMSGGTCVYATGVCTFTWTAAHAPANGAAITVSYVYAGWPKAIAGGTGLMDEDGSSSWLGTGGGGVAIADPSAWQANHAYTQNDEILDPNGKIQIATNAATSCNTIPSSFSQTQGVKTSDNNGCSLGLVWLCLGRPASRDITATAPNGSAVVQADLHMWLSQYSAEYFSVVRTAMKTDNPAWVYNGADSVGTWCVPTSRYILQGASPYVDGIFTNFCGDLPTTNERDAVMSYMTQSYTGPFTNFSALCANLDSALAGSGAQSCLSSTQASRASIWNTVVSNELTLKSYNNDYPWAGIAWWASHDFNGANGEFTNWGLKTFTDNAYNAHDAASGSIACLWNAAITCGSEPAPGGLAVRPFGNFSEGAGGVTATNALWWHISSISITPNVKVTSGVSLK